MGWGDRARGQTMELLGHWFLPRTCHILQLQHISQILTWLELWWQERDSQDGGFKAPAPKQSRVFSASGQSLTHVSAFQAVSVQDLRLMSQGRSGQVCLHSPLAARVEGRRSPQGKRGRSSKGENSQMFSHGWMGPTAKLG